ncbi:MAG TPA: divalent-cation tolerance protein CutA [Candidatus Wolfebacteria bacterium]|nr:divalent-cation tolerance protein CutA [Candidatus Wolfebacteria bacterium]
MIFIYTTCQTADEAKKIGKMIIEKKLAGCVNIWPINSMYFWKNEFKEEEETVLLIKTIEARLQEIEDLIQGSHSYSVPCIATIDIKRINRPYKEWLAQCIE